MDYFLLGMVTQELALTAGVCSVILIQENVCSPLLTFESVQEDVLHARVRTNGVVEIQFR